VYWVNPTLFFKGDRVLFIKEYRRRRAGASQPEVTDIEPPVVTVGDTLKLHDVEEHA
jgi:hypothetical protein